MRTLRLAFVLLAVLTLANAARVTATFAQSGDELDALNRHIVQLYQAGKYSEAIPVAEQALALAESLRGPDHRDVGAALNRLATLLVQQGRYADAEPLYKRALAVIEKALGPEHTEVGSALYALGVLYGQQGRYADAEPLYKRALAIKEKAVGPDHNDVATIMHGLGSVYFFLGRYWDAEPLYLRAIAIKEAALGPEHTEVGTTLHNLAVLYAHERRYPEAEPIYKRVIAIKEKQLGPDHTEMGSALYGLAELYFDQARYADAEPLYRRVLAIKERALGPEHTEIATTLYGLANLHARQGRYVEAEALYQRVLAIKVKALGPDHPHVGSALGGLAVLHFEQSQWAKAADYWRKSIDVVIRRVKRGAEVAGGIRSGGSGRSEAQLESHRFSGLIKASHRLAQADAGRAPQLAAEMFISAQWAQTSQAAASLTLMAARQAKGDGALSQLVRERQDLVAEWELKDRSLVFARSQPPGNRDMQAEASFAARLDAIDGRIGEIDKALAKDFPDYAALASPEPLAVAEAQAMLGANEALVLFLDTYEWKPTPEETFLWVVTKTDARWVRSELGTIALTEHIAALRCGLDNAAWDGEGGSRCAGLLKGSSQGAATPKPLPFDLARAHELYRALFGQVEDLIKDKHLLIIPSGPLTALPFQVLVTDPAKAAAPGAPAEYRDAAWLTKRHALTVLPSVASLKALRQFAKVSKAKEPFIGFGNPLLVGPRGTDRRAWARQSCAKSSPEPVQVASRAVRAPLTKFFRDNLADVELIRGQYPLPETADELCAVAKSAGSPESAVHLGSKATEANIKALSASGALGNARVVHFATHGLLAGETGMMTASYAEPSLLLTPPDKPTVEDDGLLTASEVSELKLDADWVVLSACNTAAGGSEGPGVEALSGLTRAFFYAGARALLVSHWAVNSQAAVSLVTKAFGEIKADGKVGRAEALRRSMLALIQSGGRNAHPATWAPFVVVGEGAR